MIDKKEYINILVNELINRFPVDYIKKEKEKNTIRFFLHNGNFVEIAFNAVMSGKRGRGSFVVSYFISIFNPFLSRIRHESFSLVYKAEKDNCNLVNYLSSLNNLPIELDIYERYLFCDTNNNNNTIENILSDIQKCFFNYIISFTSTDYTLLLESYKDINFVRNIGNWEQFIYGIIVSFLSQKEGFIEDVLVPMAKTCTERNSFLEFKRAKNYKKEFIEPIREYFSLKEIIPVPADLQSAVL